MTLQGFVAKALKLTHLSVNQNSFARKQLVPHKVLVFKILSKVLHRIWEQNMKHCVEVLSFCKPPILQNLKLSKYQRILDIHVNIRFRCHNLIFVFHHKLRFHFKKHQKMFTYFFIRVTMVKFDPSYRKRCKFGSWFTNICTCWWWCSSACCSSCSWRHFLDFV